MKKHANSGINPVISQEDPRPKGAGALSLTQTDREIFDYNRFKNPHRIFSRASIGALKPVEKPDSFGIAVKALAKSRLGCFLRLNALGYTVVKCSSFRPMLLQVVEDLKSSGGKSVDRDRVAVIEIEPHSGVYLPAGNIELRNLDHVLPIYFSENSWKIICRRWSGKWIEIGRESRAQKRLKF